MDDEAQVTEAPQAPDHAPDVAPEGDFADPLAVARRDLGERASDLGGIASVTLREGPRGKKLARWMTIKNRHTGEVHHHALTIETGKKRQGTWELDDKRSVTLSDDEVDEIGRLLDFARRSRGEPDPATAVRAGLAAVAEGLEGLPSADRAALLGELLGLLAGDREGLKRLARVAKGHPTGLAGVSAALDYGRYARALDDLEALLEADAEPPALRRVLGAHPWLVGLDHAVRVEPILPDDDEQEDQLVRQLPDGRLALVLVGSPATPALAEPADAPGAFHPSDALTVALGRAARDLAVLGGRPGASATLVLGRDGDARHQAALRAFTAHLAGVAVWTWDEVLRVGRRALEARRATVQAHVADGAG